MATLKSSVQEHTELFLVIFHQMFADLCELLPEESGEFLRDNETLMSRVSQEGFAFVAKLLPRFAKHLELALDKGEFLPFRGLSTKKGWTVPAFLWGATKHIFYPSGLVRPDADPLCVRHVRQICYLAYKYELPFTREQERQTIDGFLANEGFLSLLEIDDASPLLVKCRALLEELFDGFDPKDITPKHGPGAVATGERLEEKWEFSRLYEPIHQLYPYYDYFVVGGSRELLDRIQWYRSLHRLSTGQAKVVLVPKDSRGPRLISCEPLEYQWIQQGLNRKLVSWLEAHNLTRGHVNFSDQTINRRLARESSLHHFFCTIDLKDASDLVSLDLVRKLFPPHIMRYFEAVRSHETQLPDGSVVTLKKFAPMGSAVCFSVEALVFWVICVAVVSEHFGDRKCGLDFTYVYGDDIIVPSVTFDEVVDALTSVGLTVNVNKCFHQGDFRESCGLDSFKGVEVTPTRISTLWSSRPSDGSALGAFVSYANQLRSKGYERTGEHLFGLVEQIYGVLPHGLATSGFPNRNACSQAEAIAQNARKGFRMRSHPQYQTVQVYSKSLANRKTQSALDGWQRFLKNQCQGPGKDPDKVVLPRSTHIRFTWNTLECYEGAGAVMNGWDDFKVISSSSYGLGGGYYRSRLLRYFK